ncbi:MAG: hypothetical protein JSS66_04975 [Armatimonadetes bacterium]|nr:hypothetical protein [Armatimonadota bacterium]
MRRYSWYDTAKEVTALRKHMLRVDLRVYAPLELDLQNVQAADAHIRSLLTAGIANGLDVLGVVHPLGPQFGWRAQQMCQQENLDVWVVPGEEYLCNDKVRLLVYLLRQSMPANLGMQQACQHVHKAGGWVMVTELTKGQAQDINSVLNSPACPDAVEIYNAAGGDYEDIDVDLPKFISSASRNANDLERTNVYTLIHRKDFESYGLLPEGFGQDFKPEYLKTPEEKTEDQGIAQPGLTQPGGGAQGAS